MIGKRIERRLDLMFIGDVADIGAERLEKSTAERIAGEEPMQIASGDAAIAAHAAVGAAGQVQHRTCEFRPGGHAEMHLVTFDRHAGGKLDTRGLGESLGAVEYSVDFE